MPAAVRYDALLLRLVKDVNDIRTALRRVTVNLPLFDISNENTPDAIETDEDNYVIGNYDVIRLNGTDDITITGFRGGVKGRYIKVFNVGSTVITLAHESGSSDAENRFSFAPGIDTIITAGSSILLYYDASQSRWIEGEQLEGSTIFKELSIHITADQDDYSTIYDLIFVSSDDKHAFTGFTGGIGGRMITIYNNGNYSISLNHEDASSAVANRMTVPTSKPMAIAPGQVARIYYDDDISRWHVEGGGGFGFQEIAISEQTSTQAFPHNTDTVIVWDDPPILDQGEWFVAASNSFVVNSDGYYRASIFTSLGDVGGSDDRYDTLSVRVNGGVAFTDRRKVGNDAFTKFFNTTFPVLELSAGNAVTFSFEQTSGGSRSFVYAKASLEKIG